MSGSQGTSGLEMIEIGFGRQTYSPSKKPRKPRRRRVTSLLTKVLRDLVNNTYDGRDPSSFSGDELGRVASYAYGDGLNTPSGADRPSARLISNTVFDQPNTALVANPLECTDMFWLWGQFCDHDVDLTPGAGTETEFTIPIPTGDPDFDPESAGDVVLPFDRSKIVDGTGVIGTPREQVNEITSFIDCTNIYASTTDRCIWLRTLKDGKLKTSEGNMLPLNDPSSGMENAGTTGHNPFIAGDVRANENTGLMSLHTLLVREHNWWATKLKKQDSSLTDEELFQKARVMVESEAQHITFNEFLPLLLGSDAIPDYTGYNAGTDVKIANEFSTAAYRLGHSLVSEELWRLKSNGTPISQGNLTLRDAFFAPHMYGNDGGIDYVLRGASKHICQKLDSKIVDSLRNFLFGEPGNGGLDLASLNIQRGRDHGIPDYNTVRTDLGLTVKTLFSEITANTAVASALNTAYGGDINKIDLWVAGLCEDPVTGSQLGETFHKIVREQFLRLRDGDQLWYETRLTPNELKYVQKTTLRDLIVRNTGIKTLQKYVMQNN